MSHVHQVIDMSSTLVNHAAHHNPAVSTWVRRMISHLTPSLNVHAWLTAGWGAGGAVIAQVPGAPTEAGWLAVAMAIISLASLWIRGRNEANRAVAKLAYLEPEYERMRKLVARIEDASIPPPLVVSQSHPVESIPPAPPVVNPPNS